jgi:hypothetical protein
MDFTKTIKTLKLLLVAVLVGGASLTANAFKIAASGLYFETNGDGSTCSVTYPTTGTYSEESYVIPSTVTYNDTEYTVTSIGSLAFADCTSLKYVQFGSKLETIGYGAFEYCRSLIGVTTTQFTSDEQNVLIIPNSVKTIGQLAFLGCTSLSRLDLGEGVETIGIGAFSECTSLKGVYTDEFTGENQYVLKIPNSVKTISDYAFSQCASVTDIWIGNGCTSIGSKAFAYNGNLKTVSCMANPAPIIAAQNTFDDTDYTNAYLYIPAGATKEETQAIYDDYIAKSNYWKLFLKGATTVDGDGNNGISVGVGEVANDDIAVTTDGEAIEITGYEGETSVYNVAGMRVYQGYDSRIELTNPGIYVVIVNDKPYKVAIK